MNPIACFLQLRCCGVEGFDGYRIWRTENRNFNSNSQVPLSCCQKIWTSSQIGSNGMVNSGFSNTGFSNQHAGQMDMTGQVNSFCLVVNFKVKVSIQIFHPFSPTCRVKDLQIVIPPT